MTKIPALDLSECVDCEACLELCPEVFERNESGFIGVRELPSYPEKCVQESINCCPKDCITWQEID